MSAQAKAGERKTTGAYYTPSGLVELCLDEALDPLLDEAVAANATAEEQERALLAVSVCEPACGGGAFVTAAARRIAARLIAVRHPDGDATPTQRVRAVRDVIAETIHGVDLNPLAVELTKVALRLECLHPAMASPFLDHHLKCGNGIVGTTPKLFDANIPDIAFKALTGDDAKAATQLRKLNKRERQADLGGGLLGRFGNATRPVGKAGAENYFAPNGTQLVDPENLAACVARELAAVTEDSMAALMARTAEDWSRVTRVRDLIPQRAEYSTLDACGEQAATGEALAKLTEIDDEIARLGKLIDGNPLRHFDSMMYVDDDRADSAQTDLAQVLAHLAHVPGGVTFAGMHWALIPPWQARPGDDTPALTLAEARAVADRWCLFEQHPGLAARKFAADAWCAAFMQRHPPADGEAAITHHTLCQIVEYPDDVPGPVRATVEALARQHRFFHWDLEFPAIFHVVAPWACAQDAAEVA
jgi:hypothetical protein